jgi:hypothetical protein
MSGSCNCIGGYPALHDLNPDEKPGEKFEPKKMVELPGLAMLGIGTVIGAFVVPKIIKGSRKGRKKRK